MPSNFKSPSVAGPTFAMSDNVMGIVIDAALADTRARRGIAETCLDILYWPRHKHKHKSRINNRPLQTTYADLVHALTRALQRTVHINCPTRRLQHGGFITKFPRVESGKRHAIIRG